MVIDSRVALNAIPHNWYRGFPKGVEEREFVNRQELDSFCSGIYYALQRLDNEDALWISAAFQRDGCWVIRVFRNN